MALAAAAGRPRGTAAEIAAPSSRATRSMSTSPEGCPRGAAGALRATTASGSASAGSTAVPSWSGRAGQRRHPASWPPARPRRPAAPSPCSGAGAEPAGNAARRRGHAAAQLAGALPAGRGLLTNLGLRLPLVAASSSSQRL
ncbi:unnamed protein product, partial [Prorocentrum cordatum]